MAPDTVHRRSARWRRRARRFKLPAMTPVQSLIAFVAAASVVVITPGLDTALVLRAAASEGRRAGMLAAIGVGAGCLVWGAGVALGLTALLAASHLAFTVLRVAGAAYLIYLGARLLARPRHGLDLAAAPAAAGHPFRRGLTTNLLNPKAGVFYVSFLPQFVPPHAPMAPWTFLLAAIHVALGLIWFAALIAVIGRARAALARPRVTAWLDRATGCVFLGFGARLAWEARS
ncbi:MAG TPA: LysE family translocator [Caulobacteraceae bacterium]|jgi:threonine/homoserine/homoserine lactone efflux protein|nr:LysE family translocator [Caulobacteraceae bacterium]